MEPILVEILLTGADNTSPMKIFPRECVSVKLLPKT